MTTVLGMDFGTTNSVVAALDTDTGRITTSRFQVGDETHDMFRSVLCFWAEELRGRTVTHHAAGPAAIASYLDDPLDSRLVMSTKTYLASRNFTATSLFGRNWTLEQLIGRFLRDFVAAARLRLDGVRIVVGRPVRFAGENADDAFGELRLRAAFAEAGLPDVEVALEPEAAGFRFTRGLTVPATVLVGDFGGGTSDFSILRFEPGDAVPVTALGRSGVGIAGDALDARIMEHVVAPLLGKGTTYTPFGTSLPVPPEWYSAFAQWHRLSLMRNPRTRRDIADVRRTAQHKDRLDQLLRLIEDEQGYRLYRAVSDAKVALSNLTVTSLRFSHAGFTIDRPIERTEFEDWIAPDLRRIDSAVGDALALAGGTVDRVFLTGGTAFVPAVRALFEKRFGAAALSGGGEFVSVAEGLALIGQSRQ